MVQHTQDGTNYVHYQIEHDGGAKIDYTAQT